MVPDIVSLVILPVISELHRRPALERYVQADRSYRGVNH